MQMGMLPHTHRDLRDHVRNDKIRKRLEVENIIQRCRKGRLNWFGDVKRRDQDHVGQTLEMVTPESRRRKIRDGWTMSTLM